MKLPGIRLLSRGKYQIRVTTTDPATKQRRDTIRVVAAATAAEALQRLEELRGELAGQAGEGPPTVRAFAKRWFERHAPRWAYSTKLRIAEHLDQIAGSLGDVYVDKLTPGRVQDFLNELAKTYSGHTCAGVLRTLRALTRDAGAEFRLEHWACERVVRPKKVARYTTEEPNALDADELRRVWAAMQKVAPHWFPLFALMASTGMRGCEALGLRWCDLDFEAGKLHIRQSVYRRVIGPPKTEESRRVLPLVPAVIEAITPLRKGALDKALVFRSRTGEALTTGALNKALKRAVAAAGITKRITPQGLRRTMNTLALEVASAEVVRKVLGHTTSQMTSHYLAADLAAKGRVIGDVMRLVEGSVEGEAEAGQGGLKN